jgi:hypothetical protein
MRPAARLKKRFFFHALVPGDLNLAEGQLEYYNRSFRADDPGEAPFMEQLLLIGFGWLLGLLAPAIQKKIGQRYRANELKEAIGSELHEHRFRMAVVSYKMRTRDGELSDEFLSWFEKVLLGYKGPEAKSSFLEMVVTSRRMLVEERRQFLLSRRDPNAGVALVKYAVPLLEAHVGEISIFPMAFQSATLRVKGQVDIYNQQVLYLQGQFDKTFATSISERNLATLKANLETGYQDLGDRARLIADMIG